MKKIFQFLFLIAIAPTVNAQDIHFSQFYMSPLTINPALAGAQHDLQTVLNYKSQWQSVTNPYKTAAFSFDTRFNKKNPQAGFFAIGINFFSDRAGDAKMGTTQGGATVAYHTRINTYSTFGGGVQASFAQRSLDNGALQWGSQYDGNAFNSALNSGEPTAVASFYYLDMNAGVVYNYDNASGKKNVTNNHDQKFTVGLSVDHLNQPKYSYYGTGEKLYMKTTLHGSAILSVANTNIAFVPAFMYSRQGHAQEIYAGTLLRYTLGMDSKYTGFKQGAAISFGAFLRAQDAIAATVMLEFSHYAIGMSYDVNTSKLRTSSSSKGGFEISLRYVSPNPFAAKTSASFN